MRTLARRGIDVTFIEIVPHSTAKMVAILQDEYQSVVARDGMAREFHTVALAAAADIGRFAQTVVTYASASLEASKMRSVSTSSAMALGLSSLNHYGPTGGDTTLVKIGEMESECDDASDDEADVGVAPQIPLDWTQLDAAPAIAAVRHSYHSRQSSSSGGQIDWSNIQFKHTTQETTIKLLPNCFARGAMRAAHAMYDVKMDKRFVAKFYYGRTAIMANKFGLTPTQLLQNDVKTQVVAKRLATEFSLLPQVDDGVDFIFTSLYEIKDPQRAGLPPSMAMFTAEPYIHGAYKKYNNNNGWTATSGGSSSSSSLRETAQAFSHFTWQHTLGHIMVVDLQGVGCIFTDPQIHCVDLHEFGRGNRSEAGMAAFFCTHQCNEVCAALGLLPFSEGQAGLPASATEETKSADKDSDTMEKLMTCSCALCGLIIYVMRGEFVDAHAKHRDVFCGDCTTKVNTRETRKCAVCDEFLEISPYWYDMKGMQQPTTCKKCKTVATKMIQHNKSGKGRA